MSRFLSVHLAAASSALAAICQVVAAQEAGTDAPKPPTPAPAPARSAAQVRTGSAPRLDDFMTMLDKDHDGKVSKGEAGSYGQRFPQWDGNRDGFATRAEIHDYRIKLGIDDDGQRVGSVNLAPPRTPTAPPRIRTMPGDSSAPSILTEPATWLQETMPVPPTFAPEVKLTGLEEIRFAPGMFDNTSDTYFTCIIAITLNEAKDLTEADLKDFLEKYYRGLSGSLGKRNGLNPDIAQMEAKVMALPDNTKRFSAVIDFFDSFSDGRRITLNIEAQIVTVAASKKTCLILLVSPSPKGSPVWQTLRPIGAKAAQAAAQEPAKPASP